VPTTSGGAKGAARFSTGQDSTRKEEFFLMARMRAIEAAVEVLKREGIDTAFGLPGAAIKPMYAAMKTLGGIDHMLARHVEGASHMAEGYTRTNRGNIGVCIGTSGPAGTDMITGLYSAAADSIWVTLSFLDPFFPGRLACFAVSERTKTQRLPACRSIPRKRLAQGLHCALQVVSGW
jgi:hypothetical protein